MLAEGKKYAAGLVETASSVSLRTDAVQALVTTPGHAAYAEAVRQGRAWTMATAAAGVTVAAANVVAAANAQPLVGIYNPQGSNLNVIIHRGRSTWNSGTAGAGGLVWGVVASISASTLTGAGGVTEINALTFVAGGSGVRTYSNTAMTGVTGMVIARFAGGPAVGALAANGSHTYDDWVDGELICGPGQVCGLFAGAAGTSPIISASMSFEVVTNL